MGTTIRGLVFDLDNTLLDRVTAFIGVAESFYEEHLRDTTSVARDEAIAKMVRWDDDGYRDGKAMRARWLDAWPEAGLDTQSLTAWYRSEMERQVEPDEEINGLLAGLNERQVPWGIVTNGSPNQHVKCRAAGLDKLAPFIIVSEEAGYRKPDGSFADRTHRPKRSCFRDALEAVPDSRRPKRSCSSGDNPVADIDGAKRFGMKASLAPARPAVGLTVPGAIPPTPGLQPPSTTSSTLWNIP